MWKIALDLDNVKSYWCSFFCRTACIQACSQECPWYSCPLPNAPFSRTTLCWHETEKQKLSAGSQWKSMSCMFPGAHVPIIMPAGSATTPWSCGGNVWPLQFSSVYRFILVLFVWFFNLFFNLFWPFHCRCDEHHVFVLLRGAYYEGQRGGATHHGHQPH